MGLRSRDISVTHEGHEIALSAAIGVSTARYKLYINGQLVDEESVSFWGMLFGTVITLRGRLPAAEAKKECSVRAVANIRVFRNNDYLIFVGEKQIHHEWATLGGM